MYYAYCSFWFVCLFVIVVCYFQLLYLTAIRPPSHKDVNKLIDWLILVSQILEARCPPHPAGIDAYDVNQCSTQQHKQGAANPTLTVNLKC